MCMSPLITELIIYFEFWLVCLAVRISQYGTVQMYWSRINSVNCFLGSLQKKKISFK